jgi:hypothetical protein
LPLFAIAEFRLYRPFELVNRTTSVNSTRSEFLVEMLCVTGYRQLNSLDQ